MRLLNTSTIPVTRKTPNSGYLDPQTRQWVEGTAETTFHVNCSIQPWLETNKHNKTIKLPEGVTSGDVLWVFTTTELKQAREQLNQEADTALIDGLEYECFVVKNWKRYGLRVDHYHCLFILKDLLRG